MRLLSRWTGLAIYVSTALRSTVKIPTAEDKLASSKKCKLKGQKYAVVSK